MKVGDLIKRKGPLPNKLTSPFGIVTEVGEHHFLIFWNDGSCSIHSVGFAGRNKMLEVVCK